MEADSDLGGGRRLYLFFYLTLFFIFFSAVTFFFQGHYSLSIIPRGGGITTEGDLPVVEVITSLEMAKVPPSEETLMRAEVSAALPTKEVETISSFEAQSMNAPALGPIDATIRPDLTVRGTRTQILVTSGGMGFAIPLEVEVREGGDGRLLLDIGKTYYATDLQRSVAKAYVAAMRSTGVSLGRKDVLIRIGDPFESRVVTIEGKSAGAAIAVALVAAIEGRELRSEVLVTGTIEDDRTIGNVEGVHQKAEAAKKTGATTLVVPTGDFTRFEGLEVLEAHDLREAVGWMGT